MTKWPAGSLESYFEDVGADEEFFAKEQETYDANEAKMKELEEKEPEWKNLTKEEQEEYDRIWEQNKASGQLLDAGEKAGLHKQAEGGEQGRTGTEEIKVINGKKYRAIRESVNKRVAVKEVHKWLKGLEEYRYRKVPGVDARRITSFVNNGLNETDLPISLQKKWESAKYNKEKTLADRFIKQRISKKLTQTESKHPIKEQYDRLFTDRVVL